LVSPFLGSQKTPNNWNAVTEVSKVPCSPLPKAPRVEAEDKSFTTANLLVEDKPKVLVCYVPPVKMAEEAVLPLNSKPTPTIVETPVPVLEVTPATIPLALIVEELENPLLRQETILTHVEIGTKDQRAVSFLKNSLTFGIPGSIRKVTLSDPSGSDDDSSVKPKKKKKKQYPDGSGDDSSSSDSSSDSSSSSSDESVSSTDSDDSIDPFSGSSYFHLSDYST